MSKLSDEDIAYILENSDAESLLDENLILDGDHDSPVMETLQDISDYITETDTLRDEEIPSTMPSTSSFRPCVVKEVTDPLRDEEIPSTTPSTSSFRPCVVREVINIRQTSNDNWSYTINDLPPADFINTVSRQQIHFDGRTDIFDMFRQILNHQLLALMVEQTNIYGNQLKNSASQKKERRIDRWKDVTDTEMLKFLGVFLFTGLLPFPTLESYWKRDILYYHPLMHEINMSYNRFSIILRCWHFADNQAPRENDRPLLTTFLDNVRQIYTPGRDVVVDESMVPFRGRLLFKQYIPSKAQKYGLKIYKLCSVEGYVWSYEIYDGQSKKIEGLDLSGSIVVRLAQELLNEGRLIVTDIYYTSLLLADYLKDRNTDLLGTINKRRKGLPKEVMEAKLSKGEMAAMQNQNITVIKFHDKRDVCLLSTCHGHEMKMSKRRNPILKPMMVLDYNTRKKGIDLSDQLCSYNSPSRKTIIWYKKIAIDLMSIAVVNSALIYNSFRENRRDKMPILVAYETLIRRLLHVEKSSAISRPLSDNSHKLEKIPKKADQKSYKKRCVGCYNREQDLYHKNAKAAAAAAKKVDYLV
ncbi:unnamed protein product [Euphydryas editha]|uniref:PiggyBac transposable element-derived protein domain-containing protein n=1 Tax=Euphydryas editha TaxID=104508 RepID=A0AAU9TFH4_EUPED|nr:unnamed protein product [Euphydryas editha]